MATLIKTEKEQNGSMSEEDKEDVSSVAEEREALEAIYGEELNVTTSPTQLQYHLRIVSNCGRAQFSAELQVTLRVGGKYPSRNPPESMSLQSPALSHEERKLLREELLTLWSPRECCVYTWVEHIRGIIENKSSGADVGYIESRVGCDESSNPSEERAGVGRGENKNSLESDEVGIGGSGEFVFEPPYPKYGQKLRRFNEASGLSCNAVEITSGEPFVERKSTFQGHVATVTSKAQVDWVMRRLLSIGKIARATHNIMAYRFFALSSESVAVAAASSSTSSSSTSVGGVQYADNDEDGEDGAGAKLSQMLATMHVNNVVVVVSRWFGGVKLGPDRFRIINNTARALLEERGYASAKVGMHGGTTSPGTVATGKGHNHGKQKKRQK
jgi:putative IMPACT (imprinted ancient) family translation regulator